MKKILSLLSMLMITVMAFATDYTDQLTFKLTVGSNSSEKSLPQGTLTIEKRVDGTYNVTASGCDFSAADFGNWGDISCDGVAGTTNADGLTTIEVSKPEVFANGSVPSGFSLSGQSLLVKFNGTKAYALLKGKLALNAIVGYPFEYTFGTDEGFDGGSTGGGETGGETKEKYTVNFDKTAKHSRNDRILSGFSLQQTGKDKQTENVFASNAAYEDHTSKVFTVEAGSELTASFNYSGQWMNGYVYIDRDNDGEFSYNKGQWNQAGTDLVAYSFYTTLDTPKTNDSYGYNSTGAYVSGDDRSNVNPPAFTAPNEPGTYRIRFKVDWNCILPGGSNDILSDGGGIWDATLEVVAPAPTVAETFTYDQDAFVGPNNTKGTANVKVYKMTDDSYTMEITAPVATKVGVITVSEDAKGRTTYMGEVESSVVDGVKYVVNGVVYEEGGAKHLYMTLTHDDDTYIIGENPDAPKVVATVPFTGVTLSASNGVTGTADVTFKEMSDETVQMTFNGAGYGISATNLTKGTDAKGRTTYAGEAVSDAASTTTYSVSAVVYGEATAQKLYMTMVSVDGTTFTVGENPDPVAPETPKDVTVVEKYQADGTGFSYTINVDWDKQKIVASIDFSNGGDDKDILAMTTGDSFAAFQTSTYRTMHWYCNQTAKQMSGFFAKSYAGNNNTGRMDVADCLAKFEISKAEGLKVNGEVKMTPTVLEELLTGAPISIGSGESPKFSNAFYNYIKVVSLDWKEPTEPEVKEEKTFNEALYMQDQKVADATVVVKEMSDETVNMSLKFGENEYTSTELTKGTDTKGRTTYTGKVANGDQTYDVAGVVYEKDNVARLYMTLKTSITTVVVGENPDAVTESSNKTYTSNLRILDGETTVVEEAEANVNIIKYSDESYKVTLKNVNMLNKTQDLVFVGKALIEEAPTEATEPLTIIAKSDEATTAFFDEEMKGTFEITEVSAEKIKMGFVLNNTSLEYQGEFNYTEEETPEVYTSNLHIYDAAAPETDLFQADQAKVEFLATATGGFKLTLKDVTLNEKKSDLVFTGTLPTPQPGGQEQLAEEGETTPAEPAMVLNAIADEATTNFFGGGTTHATAVFNVSYDKNDNFMMTFTIAAGAKNYAGEFNYEKKNPETPDPELFCKENYVADGNGFEWEIAVDWETQKIVMSIDPSTCTGSCEHVIGLGASPTTFHGNLHLYRTNDQQLQGYFETAAGNNNTGKFAETAPFLVEVSKAQGFVVNNEVKIASSAMSDLFTLSTVKMGTGEGVNDKSRATYNYVKVVDKDWTAPKDPDTGINATTVAEGEVEFFTVNGVKLNKLQKGLTIVRTADGKVKKVLVK